MAPAASCNLSTDEPRAFTNTATPSAAKKRLKRKLEDLIDLTEDEDLNNCRSEKGFQATAGAKEESIDKAVDDEEPFTQSKGLYTSDDHPSQKKKKKPNETQSAQEAERDIGQEQLLSQCEKSRQISSNIADLHDHDNKHKQQRQPAVRCRKCRKTFADIAQRNQHFQTSPRHFCCRYCKHGVVEFDNADSLRYHYIDRHHELYCHFCDRHFPNTVQRIIHMEARHRSCSACRNMFPVPELHNEHCRSCYSATFGEAFPEVPNGEDGRLPTHYARLGISAHSSHEDVLKAAKEMRVKMHPDRRKRQEGLTDEEGRAIDMEAALVGQAADVLSDPDLRLRYDCHLHGW